MAKKSKQQQQQQPQATDASAKKQEVTKAAAAPQEVVAVPGFFGHVVEPGQKLVWANEVEEFVLQLNSAALGASVRSGRSTLYVLAKESKIALCTLVPETTEQFALAHTFTPLDGEIEFVVEGVNAIHLTGFIDVQDDDDDDDDNAQSGAHRHDFDDSCDSCDDDGEGDSDDSMDNDEAMMVFGDQSDSDDDDSNDGEGAADDSEDRFEVIEERVHGDAAASKKKAVVAATKDATPAKKDAKKDTTPAKKDAKKDTTPAKKDAKKDTTPAAKNDTTPVPTKKEVAAAAKTEKKVAAKVAEVTAAAAVGKKRAAPSDSVDVPKKAKNSSRVYKGVTIEEQAVGKGAAVMKGRKVSILYKGRLENGKQFDANQNRKKPFTFRHGIGDVIKGMDIGIEGMRAGGKRTILIPSKLGYGKAGAGPSIPGNANLIFDIEML